MSLTNREHGYLLRLRERCEILRARVASSPHRNHHIVDAERELKALEWAIERCSDIEER